MSFDPWTIKSGDTLIAIGESKTEYPVTAVKGNRVHLSRKFAKGRMQVVGVLVIPRDKLFNFFKGVVKCQN